MPDLDINDLSSIGVVNDIKPYMLPPEAWSLALNVRMRDRAVESLLGWEQVFGTPGDEPHFLMPISTASTDLWLWASLTDIYVYDGATHANITRASGGDYTGTNTADWNGTILGGIPIFNNGVDIPQFRANMTAGTKFANLTNWTSTVRAKVIRAFGPYLVAFHVTESSVVKPHKLIWSHPADPGSVPSSWDVTDETKDTGDKELEDVNSGVIVDAMPLRGVMYIGKETSTWRMTTIGGQSIFDFKPLYETSGVLTARCMANTGDGARQVIVTQDDMIWHKGGDPVSILDGKQRTKLFAEMDPVNYTNSFLYANPLYNEMWFCYPTAGNTHPNKALIWNYKEGGERGAITFADGITYRNAAIGNIEGDSSELWSDGEDTWDEDTGPWSEFSRRRVLLAGTAASKFYISDRGSTRDGTAVVQTLQREGLSLIGRKRNGEWIVDHQNRKLFQRLWPKISGAGLNIRLGSQEVVDGPISWGDSLAFDPATSRVADNDPLSGAALALEFSSSSKSWRMDGYKLSVVPLGQF